MTAYVVPTYFEHGDYPQNSGMGSQWNQSINHLEECIPYAGLYPVPHNPDDSNDDPDGGAAPPGYGTHVYVFRHKHRYLHFAGNDDGVLFPISVTGSWASTYSSATWLAANSTSLSGTMSSSTGRALSMSVLDLDTVDGLQYGQMYMVYDVWTAFEMPTEDVTSLAGGTWTGSMAAIADGTVVSAALLNYYTQNLDYLYRISNKANEGFKIKHFDDSVAWHFSFRKQAARDYLFYHMECTTAPMGDNGVDSVKLYISADPSGGWGSDYLSGEDTALGISEFATGYVNISALSDDTLYAVSIDVTLDAAGAMKLYMLHESAVGA